MQIAPDAGSELLHKSRYLRRRAVAALLAVLRRGAEGLLAVGRAAGARRTLQ